MIGVVLAGGASQRFGGQPKGLMMLNGMPMVMHVHQTLSQVCRHVFIEARAHAGYQALGVDCLYAAPGDEGKGPLAGIAVGLAQAASDDRVAFAPCDMPLLCPAIFERLGAEPECAYAVSSAGMEPLVCVLPARVLVDARAALSSARIPGVRVFLEQVRAVPVHFDDAMAFSNVNTVDDLPRAEAYLVRG